MQDRRGHIPWLRPTGEAFLVAIFLSIIYLALPTRNYYWDGIIYGEFLDRTTAFGAGLFHPNHLIYNFAGHAAFQTLQAFHLVDRALFALQYLTIFFAAVSVGLFYLICRRLFDSVYISVVVTGLLAFSASWWRYATDADVYIISISFLLLAFYLLIGDRPRPVAAALAFFGGMLFHELAILFFPAACFALWRSSDGLTEARRNIAKFTVLSAGSILSSYTVAYHLLGGSSVVGPFSHWVTNYAGTATMGPELSHTLFWMVKGTRQLFVDGSTKLIQRDLVSYVSLSVFVLCSIALLVSLFRFRSKIYQVFSTGTLWASPMRYVMVLCVAWIVPYVAFLLLFEPQNTFYRLFYLPPAVLLAGFVLNAFERPANIHYARALLMLVFALYNFVFYIYPNSQVRPGSVLALALDAEKVWNNKTLVVFEERRPTEGVIRTVMYFNPTPRWRPVDSLSPEEIRTVLANVYSDGGAVWIERAALRTIHSDPARYEALRSSFSADEDTKKSVPEHDLEFTKLVPQGAPE